MNAAFSPSYDAIVVGSGPGGATVARQLARRGSRVLVLEQGSAAPRTGTLGQMAKMAAVPGKGVFIQRDASLLVQGITAGGSSAVNFATAAAPPPEMFAAYGIDLAPAFQSRHFAAHPGGSVRIGDGVDSDLRAGSMREKLEHLKASVRAQVEHPP